MELTERPAVAPAAGHQTNVFMHPHASACPPIMTNEVQPSLAAPAYPISPSVPSHVEPTIWRPHDAGQAPRLHGGGGTAVEELHLSTVPVPPELQLPPVIAVVNGSPVFPYNGTNALQPSSRFTANAATRYQKGR